MSPLETLRDAIFFNFVSDFHKTWERRDVKCHNILQFKNPFSSTIMKKMNYLIL